MKASSSAACARSTGCNGLANISLFFGAHRKLVEQGMEKKCEQHRRKDCTAKRAYFLLCCSRSILNQRKVL